MNDAVNNNHMTFIYLFSFNNKLLNRNSFLLSKVDSQFV